MTRRGAYEVFVWHTQQTVLEKKNRECQLLFLSESDEYQLVSYEVVVSLLWLSLIHLTLIIHHLGICTGIIDGE